MLFHIFNHHQVRCWLYVCPPRSPKTHCDSYIHKHGHHVRTTHTCCWTWSTTMRANSDPRIIITILALIFVALNCRPFAATWNPYLGSCQTQISMTTVSIIVSAVQMCTDWACAVIPFFIVAGLQMSVRKKVSVIIILGLGVVASICTVIRLPYLKYYDTTMYPTETLCE